MKRFSLWAFVIAVVVVAVLLLRGEFDDDSPSGRPPNDAVVVSELPQKPPPPAPFIEALIVRGSAEMLVFAVGTRKGVPAAGGTLLLLDGTGATLAQHRLDEHGTWRGSVPSPPPVVAEVRWGDETLRSEVPPPRTPLPPPPSPLIVDREFAAPGDPVSVVALGDGPVPIATAVPPEADGPAPGVFEEVIDFGSGTEKTPWRRYLLDLPYDIAPTTLRIQRGDAVVELPVRSRRRSTDGAAPSKEPAFPAAVRPAVRTVKHDSVDGSDPAPPFEVTLQPGGLLVDLTGSEEGGAVMAVVLLGDRLLSHSTAGVRDSVVDLDLPFPAGVDDATVLVATTSRTGVLSGEWPAPHQRPGPGLGVRARRGATGSMQLHASIEMPAGLPRPLAAFAIVVDALPDAGAASGLQTVPPATGLTVEAEDTAPHLPRRYRALAWIPASGVLLRTEGEMLPRPDATPPEPRPGFVRPGDPWNWPGKAPTGRELLVQRYPVRPGSGITLALPPRGTPLSDMDYTVLAPTGASGPLRLRFDDAIVLATFVQKEGFEPRDGRRGTLRRETLDANEGTFTLEHDVPDLVALVIEKRSLSGKDARAAGSGMVLRRTVPATVAHGKAATLRHRVELTAGYEGPVEIRCPLPAGVAPSEDAWILRRRLPPGARVMVGRDAVRVYLVSLPPEGVDIEIPVVALHPGTWVLPPAAAGGDTLDTPWAHCDGTTFTVEP